MKKTNQNKTIYIVVIILALVVLGGIIVFALPTIDFYSPTLDNDTYTLNNWTTINATISSGNVIDTIGVEWNNTNITYIDSHLMMAFNFDNVPALGDNATQVYDISGNGMTGTIGSNGTNRANYSNGRFNGGIWFDGVDDVISFPSTTFDLSNTTFSFWAKRDNTTSNQDVMANSGTKWNKVIYFNYPSTVLENRLTVETDTNNEYCSGRIKYNDFGWHHYAVIFDDYNCSFYQDGHNLSLVTAQTGANNNITLNHIGNRQAQLYPFNGTLDELFIFNRSLDISEVHALYMTGLSRTNTTDWQIQSNWSIMKAIPDSMGHNLNPTGDPVGGGVGYSNIINSADADYHVTDLAGFLSAVSSATSGEIIYVNDSVEINLSCNGNIYVPEGVTIASGRGRDGSNGALLYSQNITNTSGVWEYYYMFRPLGNDTRFTGLRIQGPDNQTNYNGLTIKSEFSLGRGINSNHTMEVDNCEISGWAYCGICIDYSTNKDKSYIHHNYIHHNQRMELGYGVQHIENYSSSLIEANLFDYNRHSVAGSGQENQCYEARYNQILSHATGHVFDMHGGNDRGDGTDIAGKTISIHHNTIEVMNYTSVQIRGTPTDSCDVYQNYINHSKGYAIQQSNSVGNMHVYENCFAGWCYHLQDGTHTYSIWASDSTGSNTSEIRTLTKGPISVTFIPPTPSNNSYTSDDFVYINTTTSGGNTSNYVDWNNSLVAYYSMDYYNSTGVFDNSSNSNFGEFEGAGFGVDNLTTGKWGKGLVFDGVDDYVDCGGGRSLSLDTSSFTIEMWLKVTSDYASYGGVELKHKYDYAPYLRVEQTTGIRGRVRDSTDSFLDVTYSPAGGLGTDWWHLALVRDYGTKIYLYANGVEVNAKVDSLGALGPFVWMRIGRVASWYLKGSIDEVRIYNRALSAAEISASYNGSAEGYGVNITNQDNGTYAYKVGAIDEAGNLGFSEMMAVSLGGVDSCRTIYESTGLIQDIVSDGSCIVVGGNGLTLDCNGYSIIGNKSGIGINITHYNDTTITNCTVTNFSKQIFAYDVANISFKDSKSLDAHFYNATGIHVDLDYTNCRYAFRNAKIQSNPDWDNCNFNITLPQSRVVHVTSYNAFPYSKQKILAWGAFGLSFLLYLRSRRGRMR